MKKTLTHDEQTRAAEFVISLVLRGGVFLSAAVIGLGLILSWVKPSELQHLKSEIPLLLSGKTISAQPIRQVPEFFSQVADLDPSAIMSLGLLILICLPIARVALTVGLFLKEKDYTFLIITGIVLSVLLFGILFGKGL